MENHGERLAEMWMDPLLIEVRTYGLHLQTLDIRQHARVHAAAVAEIAGCAQSSSQTSADCSGLRLPSALSPQTTEVLETFRAIAELKRKYPPEAIRQYVISGATSAEDVLHVLWLARLGGVKVETDGDDPGLQPVPLFESIEDLPECSGDHAPPVVERGLSTPVEVLGSSAGDHAGLLGFEQRWRHDHQHMGDLEGAPRDCIVLLRSTA